MGVPGLPGRCCAAGLPASAALLLGRCRGLGRLRSLLPASAASLLLPGLAACCRGLGRLLLLLLAPLLLCCCCGCCF